jgi:hypothetical protein
MSCMEAFQVRCAWLNGLATVVTDVGRTQPESEIWPSLATVTVAGKLAKTWQSA